MEGVWCAAGCCSTIESQSDTSVALARGVDGVGVSACVILRHIALSSRARDTGKYRHERVGSGDRDGW